MLAIVACVNYITSPDHPLRHENLYIVAFLLLYSLVLFLPYVLFFAFKWKVCSRKVRVATSTPFVLMLFCALFAEFNGVPW